MGFTTYNQIVGISDIRRMPRLGKIRLGVRKTAGSGAEYPAEVPYFVLTPEDCPTPAMFNKFQKVYGPKPTELVVMFPVEDPRIFFPQRYAKYGKAGLVCKGDGCTFSRVVPVEGGKENETEIVEGDCPSPEDCDFARDSAGRTVCKRIASLTILLPEITLGGTWQIDTSSFNSIVDLNSAIDYFRSLVGRIAMVPFKLRRQAKETQYGGKKATHYPMQLGFPDSREEVQKLGQNFRAVLDVFEVFRGRPQLAAPDTTSIPEDLYPKDVVREAKRALPAPAPEPEPEPEPVPEDLPPQSPPEGQDPGIDYKFLDPPEPGQESPPAPEPAKRRPGRPRRTPARVAGEAAADAVAAQREARTPTPAPEPAPAPRVIDQKPAAPAKALSLF